jgi:hypothetical protein
MIAALTAAVLLATAQGSADGRDKGPDRLDVSSYPAEEQARYPLFQEKCSRCHTLARPINSRFTVAAWKRYAKKMIQRPNSGINEEEAEELYAFLRYYAARTAP